MIIFAYNNLKTWKYGIVWSFKERFWWWQER